MELENFSRKNSNLLFSYSSSDIKIDIMQNHEQKQKLKKPNFYGQNNFYFF
jgi:hypothetical protein